jgi:hypothetical protein
MGCISCPLAKASGNLSKPENKLSKPKTDAHRFTEQQLLFHYSQVKSKWHL